MKYTAKDIREQRVSFKDLTREEYSKIYKHFKKLYPQDYKVFAFGNESIPKRYHSFCCRSYKGEITSGWSQISFTNKYWFKGCENHDVTSKDITFDEFDFEEISYEDKLSETWTRFMFEYPYISKYEVMKLTPSDFKENSSVIREFQLPKKWACKVTKDNIGIMKKYVGENCIGINYSDTNTFNENLTTYIANYRDGSCIIFSKPEDVDHTEITFEQFKEHILKQKEMTYKIPLKRFLKLVDAACDTWKEKLNTHIVNNLCPSTGTVLVLDRHYEEMLAAATVHKGIDQKKVIEEVFNIKEDPYQHLKEAWIAGKPIQLKGSNGSWTTFTTGVFTWLEPVENYRIKHKHQDIIDEWEKDKSQIVQYSDYDNDWHDCHCCPLWAEDTQYRIKPKKELVPFDYSDSGKLIGKAVIFSDMIQLITAMTKSSVNVCGYMLTYKDLLNRATFLDGSKCGKLKS